jgi:hypothetical protein
MATILFSISKIEFFLIFLSIIKDTVNKNYKYSVYMIFISINCKYLKKKDLYKGLKLTRKVAEKQFFIMSIGKNTKSN